MRVVIYGDAAPASGGWCYAETLRDMGHEVQSYLDPDSLEFFRTRQYRLYRRFFRALREGDRREHVAGLRGLVDSFRPDLVLIQKGLFLAADDIEGLRGTGAWVCNVNHDDFFSLNPNNRNRLQLGAVPAYDHIFTTREVNVEEIRPLNPRVEFFPFAYYPRIHCVPEFSEADRARWSCDAVFVGTYERPRAEMLEQLVEKTPLRLEIHGRQWERLSRFSPLRRHLRTTGVRFDDFARALRYSSVCLGFLRKENRDDYTQRTFEIPACGGVLLAERTARHLSYYQEGKEAEFFDANSPAELAAQLAALLDDHVRRERLREAGHQAVLRGHHTYRDRLERLLEVYGKKR